MAISLASIKKSHPDRPPIILIHGGPGIGKTSFAAGAEGAVFIRTEDGLGNLEVDAFPLAQSFADAMEALTSLYTDEHAYRWVVIDSLSALEPMIWAAVARSEGKDNVEGVPYGRGYTIALNYWQNLLDCIAALARDKGIGTILVAHSDIVVHNTPETDSYDRVQIKLHKRAFQLMYERCDVIGYMARQVLVQTKSNNASGKGNKGIAGQRLLHLNDTAAFVAKNRYSLPSPMPIAENDPFAAFPMLIGAIANSRMKGHQPNQPTEQTITETEAEEA